MTNEQLQRGLELQSQIRDLDTHVQNLLSEGDRDVEVHVECPSFDGDFKIGARFLVNGLASHLADLKREFEQL